MVLIVARADLMLGNVERVHPAFNEILEPLHPTLGEIDGMACRIARTWFGRGERWMANRRLGWAGAKLAA